MKGDMQLPTIQQGKRKVVDIKQGQVFLLPSRIPHSPQRQVDTFGLVCERKRYPPPPFLPPNGHPLAKPAGVGSSAPEEVDGLRWYRDFTAPADVLWERFFHCGDLERDLVPVPPNPAASPSANSFPWRRAGPMPCWRACRW